MNKEELIKTMKQVLSIQGYDGNWDYDEYMYGMYNGMEYMVALAEGREPEYRKQPKQWGKDKVSKEIAVSDSETE